MEPHCTITRRGSPVVSWLKSVCVAVLCVHVLLSAWSKFFRTPPPRVRELAVQLRR